MLLIITSLIFSFLITYLISISFDKKLNKKNEDSIFLDKKKFFSIYKSLKEKRDPYKTKDRLTTILKVLFDKNKFSEVHNKIKYLYFLIPVLVVSIYLFTGSPFYNPREASNLDFFTSDNLDKLVEIDFSKIKFKSRAEQLDFYLKLAVLGNNSGNLKAEIFALEKLSSLDNENLELKITLAKKLTQQSFGIVTSQSRELIREILEVNPSQEDALYLAGMTAIQNNQKDLAFKIWNKILSSKGNSKYKVLIERMMEEYSISK